MLRLLLVLLVSVPLAAAQPVPGPDVPFDWTGYPEVGGIGAVNPAGFAFAGDLRLRIGAAFSDSAFEGLDAFSLALPGGGLSGWWEDAESLRRFSTSGAVGLPGGMAAVGLSYEWFDPTVSSSPWRDADRWTVGLLARPSEWLSVGLVRRGGVERTDSTDIEPEYRAGAAFRPFGGILTLTADVGAGTELEDVRGFAGAELRPVPGLTLRLAAGEDAWRAGVELGFGFVSVAGSALAGESFDVEGSRIEAVLSSAPGVDLLAPRGYFVRFSAGGADELPVRPFLGDVAPCFTDQALLLRRLASDPSVAGVIVDIEEGEFNAAQAEELRGLLQGLRASGKPVYAFLRNGGNRAYYLASCADSVWMHPSGHVSFGGLGMETFFVRELLDSLGIYPDLLHIGEYKSASDMLTRSDMSEAQAEATLQILGSMQDVLVDAVMQARGLDAARIDEIMDSGGFTGGRAVAAGLVDGTAYADEVEELIGEGPGGGVESVPLEQWASRQPVGDGWGPREHVAVVVATGTIVSGESGSMFPIGRTMGSRSIAETLETAASVPGTKALVLRIDSGGGDALASDDMHHAIAAVARRMPVVVSMGAVAASGGYYMACGADRIFADRLTITGSIGIISGKIVFGGLLDSLGVNVETVQTAPMATMYSTFRPFTDAERDRAMDLMRDGYELFVSRVAEGRGMTFAEVDSIGRGRIWSGADALGIGLVDEWGGVADAVIHAARAAGMDAEGVPAVEVYPVPSFPGSLSLPGAGITAGLRELLTGGMTLFLAPSMTVE